MRPSKAVFTVEPASTRGRGGRGFSLARGWDNRASVAVSEEVTSAELVLVAPPEIAARARDSLPDYPMESDRWATSVSDALGADEVEVQSQDESAEVEAVERKPEMGAAEFWSWYEERPRMLEWPEEEQQRSRGALRTAAIGFAFLASSLCLIALVLLIASRG